MIDEQFGSWKYDKQFLEMKNHVNLAVEGDGYMSTTFMGLLSRMLRGSEARRRRIFHGEVYTRS